MKTVHQRSFFFLVLNTLSCTCVIAFALVFSTASAQAQSQLPMLPELNCDDIANTSQSIIELAGQNQNIEQIFNTLTPADAPARIQIQNLFLVPPIVKIHNDGQIDSVDHMREHCRHNQNGYIQNANAICDIFIPLIEQTTQARDNASASLQQSEQYMRQYFESSIPRGTNTQLDLANTTMVNIGSALVRHIYATPEKDATQFIIEFNNHCRYNNL